MNDILPVSMVDTAVAERLNAERLPAERTPVVPFSSSALISVVLRRGHSAPTGVFETFSMTQSMEAASSSATASELTMPRNLASKSAIALKSKSTARCCSHDGGAAAMELSIGPPEGVSK